MQAREAGYRLLASAFIASLATLQFGMLCWGMAHPGRHWLMRHFLLGAVMVIAALGVGIWELRQTHKYAATLRQLGITKLPEMPGINIVEVPTALAVCLGLFRPEIYVSRGLIEQLSPKQLQAVLDHETYHQSRFDPLRILIIDMLAAPLFFLPAVQEWRRIQSARLELKADAYAVGQTGRVALAGALHTLLSEEMLPVPQVSAGLSVSTVRVATLLGERQPLRISVKSLVISTAILWTLCLLLMF